MSHCWHRWSAGALLAAGLLLPASTGATPPACPPGDAACGWTRLLTGSAFGSMSRIRDMAVDPAGNVYLAGETYSNTGRFSQSAALVTKYDASGNLVWLRRLSPPGEGLGAAWGIDADGAGNICVGGRTDGAFGSGKAIRGGGFVARYDKEGSLLWAVNSASAQVAAGLDASGNCYAASLGEVAKYNPRGKLLWAYRGEIGAMAVGTSGQVYLASLPGDMPQPPSLVMLSADGKEIRRIKPAFGKSLGWAQPDFRNPALAIDGQGNIYLQATISGMDGKGRMHVGTFAAKIDPGGKLLWERHHGGEGYRWDSFDISVDGQGNVYLAGRKTAMLAGGSSDIFVIRYGPDGSLHWESQFGTAAIDVAGRIATDRAGNYYIAGVTEGDLDNQKNPARNRTATPFIARNRPAGK